MPFLTEELWHQLPQRAGAKSISLAAFPIAHEEWKDDCALEQFALIQNVIVALRNIRAEMKLDPKKKVSAELSAGTGEVRAVIEANREGILRLAVLSKLRTSGERIAQAAGIVRSAPQFDVRIPFATDVLDIAAEKARLQKEIDRLTKTIPSKEAQLAKPTFRDRAPEEIVRAMEASLAEQKQELAKLQKRLADLEGAA